METFLAYLMWWLVPGLITMYTTIWSYSLYKGRVCELTIGDVAEAVIIAAIVGPCMAAATILVGFIGFITWLEEGPHANSTIIKIGRNRT
jgi:hypothetical protein